MDLPADILLAVFDHLLPPKTRRERAWLHSLLHVSRSFRGYLEPRLYQTLAEHDLYFPDERERRRELYDHIVAVHRKSSAGYKTHNAEIAWLWNSHDRVILRKHPIPLLFRTLVFRADLAKRVKGIFLQDVLEDKVDHWHKSGWVEIETRADLPECFTPEESKKVQKFVERRFKKYGKRVGSYRQRWVEASRRWSVNVCALLILCLTDNLEHLTLKLHYKELQKGITLTRLRCLRNLNLETRFHRDWFFLDGRVSRLTTYTRDVLDERSPYALYRVNFHEVMDDAYPLGDSEFETFQRQNKDQKEAAKTVSEEAHRRVAARNPTSADILAHLSSYSSQGLIEFSFEGRWHPSRSHDGKLSFRQLLLKHKCTLERLQVIVQPYTDALRLAGVGLGSLGEFTKLKYLSTQPEALLGDGPRSRKIQLKDILPPNVEILDFSSSNGYYVQHVDQFLHATDFDDGDRVRLAREADLKAFQDLEGAIKDEPDRLKHLKQVRMRVGLVNWYMGLPEETVLPRRMSFAADSPREYIFFSDKQTAVSYPKIDD